MNDTPQQDNAPTPPETPPPEAPPDDEPAVAVAMVAINRARDHRENKPQDWARAAVRALREGGYLR